MKRLEGKSHLWAWVVSRVFDPIVEIPLILVLVAWVALSNGLRWRFIVFLLVFEAILPAGFFVFGLLTKKIKDWDITRRQDRMGLYFFTIFTHLFGVIYAYFLGKHELSEVLLILWGLAVIFAVVTYFWKISVHAGVNGALVAVVNHYYGWGRFWWLVVVLLLVLWARVVMKKHTVAQVSMGAIMALAWVSFGLSVISN